MKSEHVLDGTTVIRPYDDAHVDALAKAHAECFPGYFLTRLGDSFLKQFYGHYLRSGFGFGVVALAQDGTVAAFAVGVTDLDAHDASFVRRHRVRIAMTVAGRWCVDGVVRKQVSERWNRLVRVATLRVRRKRSTQPQQAVDREIPYATLTSVGVVPAFRGSGLAEMVVSAFGEEVRARGYATMRVATALDNHRAIAFYERTGWSVESVQEKAKGVTFERAVGLEPSG